MNLQNIREAIKKLDRYDPYFFNGSQDSFIHFINKIHIKEFRHIKNLEITFNHRNQDGVFDITWNWNQYPENFEKAKQIWMGIIALKTLRVSQEYQFIKKQI